MTINVTINISEAPGREGVTGTPRSSGVLVSPSDPFPQAGVDVFLSHFIISLKIAGRPGLVHLTLPSAVQTVARSRPFVYADSSTPLAVDLPIPSRSTLASRVSESEFLFRPSGFFNPGHETIWLQILNIDARARTDIGAIRIILGETLKREYPDLFLPSFGAVESLGERGFPARLFFSPVAVIETPFGKFRTAPKALVASNINSLPPIGAPPVLQSPVALHSVDDLRSAFRNRSATLTSTAEVVALAHPIDAALLQDPEQAFADVESGASAPIA